MLARTLVTLDHALSARTPALDPFDPGLTQRLAETPEVADVCRALPKNAISNAHAIVRLVLQALRLQRAALTSQLVSASLVVTAPGELPLGTRSTAAVIAEMLRGSAHEVVALGYDIRAEEVLERLREMAAEGTDVTLIVDHNQTPLDVLLMGWPARRKPRLYVAQLDKLRGAMPKMHGKALLVNGSDLLITSANLTFHGLYGNIELGVRLQGEPAAETRRLLEHMVRVGALVEVPL